MRHTGETITGEKVVFDDNEYIDCKFVDCNLSFGGGSFHVVNCSVLGDNFSLSLSGPAAGTLVLLQMLASQPGSRQYVIDMLDPRKVNHK